MNLERLLNSRGMSADDIETKNWICRRYELWLGSERRNCYVRRKHKKRNRR
nr:MAG TPA: hypothetical protein [Caudoviricetes sp.]